MHELRTQRRAAVEQGVINALGRRAVIRRLTEVLLALVPAGCGLSDPDDDGPDERVMPGIFGAIPSATILAAEPARVGALLDITVFTEVRGGCGGYGVTGPRETAGRMDGLEVEVLPFDLVQRTEAPTSDAACTLELRLIPHQVTVVPQMSGTLTIRAVGRRLQPDQRVIERGEPVTREVAGEVER